MKIPIMVRQVLHESHTLGVPCNLICISWKETEMSKNEKVVLHVGAHLVTQGIAGSLTKDWDDNSKKAGMGIALMVGLILNLIIATA